MTRFLLATLLGILFATPLQAGEPLRVDGSSDERAELSWGKMLHSVSAARKQELLEAMVRINLAGVKSAYELAGNPDVRNLNIARIREQVDGMTAEEILALADEVGTVTIKQTDERTPSGG